MNEGDWLASTDPLPMLEFLRRKASGRKLRLFACACCRHIWNTLMDARSTNAIELSERYADDDVSEKDFIAARAAAVDAYADLFELPEGDPETEARIRTAILGADAVLCAAISNSADAAGRACGVVVACATSNLADSDAGDQVVPPAEQVAQSDLVRDIFGNPFCPIFVERFWLTPTVVSLAERIYDKREFDCLPNLASALIEAGCANADILAHCRQPGKHGRGCWVVDLLLGKK
jgi:hypothetical protein